MKIIRPFTLVVLGVYVVLGSLTQCATMDVSKKSVEKQFEKSLLKPTFHSYEVGGNAMHYVAIGDIKKPMVVFVHGSPGGWSAYLDYLKDTALTNNAYLVSVDRAGYGQSNDGEAQPSLEAQAAMIMPILATSQATKKPLLVGHSLGGPIIARMAMDYSNEIGALLFLAPSIDPGMEKYEWYRPLMKTGIVRAILPKSVQASNLELMPLKSELEKMLPLWQNIRIPSAIMHGKKDILVPFENVQFYEKMLVNAPIKEVISFEKENHFIPWTQFEAVKTKLLEMINRNTL